MRMRTNAIHVLLILAITLVSCIGSAGGEQPPAPATPSPLPSSPAPSGEAQQTVPPTVVAVQPEPGAELSPAEPIVISFDQPMDPSVTAAAFAISPQVSGKIEVDGSQLIFTPGQPLAYATHYQVSISQQARSLAGQALLAPFTQRFATVGFLDVSSTQPADGATDVAVDGTVTVVFNRPVVPVQIAGQGDGLPDPLTFEPAVEGEGSWLNTSVYQFRPEAVFAASTRYRVSVAAGLQDTTGSVLPDDFVFTFRTADPTVVSTLPQQSQVPPTGVVTVTFSQPMDRASAEAAFSLTPQVAGTFTWDEEGRTFTFTPDAWLPYDTQYVAKVAATARPAEGEGTLRQEMSWRFRTVALPRVVRSNPADGEEDANPYGGLEVFFASPIDPATITDEAITIIPKPTTVYTYWSSYDNRLFIGFTKQPAVTYNVVLADSIGDAYGNTLVEPVVIRFTTRNLDPQVSLGQLGNVGTYNAYASTTLLVQHVNVSWLDVTLYRIDEATFMYLLGEGGYRARQDFRPSESDLVERRLLPVKTPRNQTGQSAVALDDGDGLAPGLYYAVVTAPEIMAQSTMRAIDPYGRSTFLVVSRLNLTLKNTVDEALVWATDLQSGEPLADLPVRVVGPQKPLAEGRTDGDGVFRGRYERQEPWHNLFVFVGSGDTFGAVMNQWNEGIGPWKFGISSQLYRSDYRAYLYTERPIYRPGQTVYWKGVLRTDDDARYSLPDLSQPLVMEVRNDRGQTIITKTLALNDFGTVNGEFRLDAEATLGYYSISLRLLGQDYSFGSGFQVAEYRKPELELTVVTDQPEVVQGDTITVDAQAQYYFGGPVKEAEVRWTVLSDDYYFYWQPEGEWRYFDFTDDTLDDFLYERYGETIASGVGVTDDEGRFTVQLPADVGKRVISQRWTLEVAVTDVNNQEVAGRASVVVHRGEYYIGLSPRRYVGAAGTEQEVDVVTVDSGGNLLPNTTFTIVASERAWFSVKEQAENGQFYWVSKPQDTPLITQTLTTDDDGQAVFRFTPENGGVIAVTASGRDTRGNEIRTTTLLWISARSNVYVNWRRENNDRIELVADKKAYRVGETAEVLIPSPYDGEIYALLTLERGSIFSHQLIRLSSNSETVKIPILPEYAPNVYVSLLLVKGMDATSPAPSFKIGIVELPVSVEREELAVTLSASGEQVGPRQTVTYTVVARDYTGQPVAAEVSLALVDKAIFSLAAEQQSTMLDYFYSQRGLGVSTSTVLVVSLDRLNQQLTEGAKGGGGGDLAGGVPVVRQEFPDTAFWNPVVQTGPDGRAEVSVTLPDNLTTWRMTAKALTAATEVGEAERDVVSTLDLLVRPVTPRFFVDRDRAEIAAVVHNNTDTSLDVHVELTATGLVLADAPARDVTIPAAGLYKLVWPVEVSPDVDEVTLLFSATSDGPSDAVRLTLPVHHYVAPDTAATAGEVTAEEPQRLELIALPPLSDPMQGELRVRIEPSLAAGLRAGLKYLTYYEYDSTEMILSRFLPNVVTFQAVLQSGGSLPSSLSVAELMSLVSEGMQRLYGLQHPDGGWGWWARDASHPFLTAYVLFGLTKAKQAGFAVDAPVMDRARAYLTRQLKAPTDFVANYEANQQAFILYALAEAGQEELSRAVTLFDYRERLGHYGRAFLAMALALSNPNEPTRSNTLLDDLLGQVVISATGAHWEEAWVDRYTMNTDIRTTAIVLDALVRLRPKDPLIPNVVRWLMAVRNGGGYWATTQESVWSILSLTDWMVASGELEANYAWRVLLNQQTFGRGNVDSANLDEVVELKAVVAGLLRQQANALLFERLPVEGVDSGRLYYTAHLRVFRPVEAVEATSRGIFISRQYSLADAPDQPIESARVGDIIQVKLTIVAPDDLSYVVVEDPFPAGAEAVDVSLDTTRTDVEGPELTREVAQPTFWWNTWVPSRTSLRDEKAVLFATYLPRGTYEYTYLLRAGLPGEFRVIPATAWESYFPEVYGRTDGALFTITE